MFIMYVDESGDPGPHVNGGTGNSRHFILSGLVVPVACWNDTLVRLKDFRREVRRSYGLPMREELHAAELIRIDKIDAYRTIKKRDRIKLLGDFVAQLPTLCAGSVLLNVCFDKQAVGGAGSFKAEAWTRLIQRYDTYIRKAGGTDAHGLLIADGVEDVEVRGLLRKMRVFNMVPSRYGGKSRNLPTTRIIEDVVPRDSRHSYFVQAADAVAHVLYRKEYPRGALKKYRVEGFFDLLDGMLVKAANGADPQGIVRK